MVIARVWQVAREGRGRKGELLIKGYKVSVKIEIIVI
jgi:hypothetical protein